LSRVSEELSLPGSQQIGTDRRSRFDWKMVNEMQTQRVRGGLASPCPESSQLLACSGFEYTICLCKKFLSIPQDYKIFEHEYRMFVVTITFLNR
jgi:hypothetical protein